MTKKSCFTIKYSLKKYDYGCAVDTFRRIMLTLQKSKIARLGAKVILLLMSAMLNFENNNLFIISTF